MAGSSQQYKGHPCGNRRTDRLRKNSFHPWSAWRPLPRGLSTYRGPVPHGVAQQDLSPAPLDLGGPWGLRCRSRRAPSWLPAGLLPGISGRANIVRYSRLLGHKGADKEEGHALWVSFQWPPCEAICLGPHTKIQLCPERPARADALGRPLPL